MIARTSFHCETNNGYCNVRSCSINIDGYKAMIKQQKRVWCWGSKYRNGVSILDGIQDKKAHAHLNCGVKDLGPVKQTHEMTVALDQDYEAEDWIRIMKAHLG